VLFMWAIKLQTIFKLINGLQSLLLTLL